MASRLQDVLLRGVAASRPLATAVAIGTLYYSTDLAQTHQSDGSAWNVYTDGGGGGGLSLGSAPVVFIGVNEIEDSTPFVGPPPLSQNVITDVLGITVDGGGSAITTGVKGYFLVPYNCTIIGNRVLADQSGSIVFDVWKDILTNYPPTVADTITAAAKPTLSTQDHSSDDTLTGWTKSIKAGDVLGYNVDSATTVTRVTLELIVVKAP